MACYRRLSNSRVRVGAAKVVHFDLGCACHSLVPVCVCVGERETGLLFISDAKLLAANGAVVADVTAHLAASVVDGELLLANGVRVGGAAEAGASTLMVSYRINGQDKKRAWRVSTIDGALLEPIELVAPGQVAEMDEVVAVERLFADFFLNLKTIQRRITEPQRTCAHTTLVHKHKHKHKLTHDASRQRKSGTLPSESSTSSSSSKSPTCTRLSWTRSIHLLRTCS